MTRTMSKKTTMKKTIKKSRPDSGERKLADWRRRIDAIDARIIALLNQRSRIARKIGELKRARGGALYVPEREQAVLSRLRALNKGPLSDQALEAIYREIMSAALALEGPLHIGVAGAADGPVAAAARNHFGASAKVTPVSSPTEAVAGMCEGRWDALCIAESDMPAACAEVQAGRLRICARSGTGVAVLVRAD